MKKHIYQTRVRYAEVDQMGVVYYANYLAYLESARTGLLRESGFPYGKMEEKGFLLPVTECHVKYKGSARFDEVITVEATLGYLKNASIKFIYTVRNEAGETILTGFTIHALINSEWKIISIPGELKASLSEYVEA